MSVSLTELPDTARIWIYGAERALTESEREYLTAELLAFVDRWTAHGADLRAGVQLVEGRFAVVAVDEASAPASGCSIDAMVRRLAELEQQVECSLLDGTRVFYRSQGGAIAGCDRVAFKALAANGAIEASTPVFDVTIATLGELRSGALELPLSRSWHRGLVEGTPTRS